VKVLKRLLGHKSARAGGILLVGILAMAILAPWISPEGYNRQVLGDRLQEPSSEHIMGTDQFGRELKSRIVWGARISLRVGVMAMAISLSFGTVLGLVAGFYGGSVERVIMGFVDVLLAFPGILLAIFIVAVLGPGLSNAMIAVGIAGVPQFARLVRGSTLSVRETEYIEAQHALGSPDFRIVSRHIMPNIIAPIVVLATLNIGTAILAAAGLGFLGLGAEPPVPEWGAMISQGRQHLRSAWWVGVFPGMAILVTVLGFNLLGDGLRDALDPRVRIGGAQPGKGRPVAPVKTETPAG